jgi:hypothetical protein
VLVGQAMNIDLADMRELTFYSRDALRGVPELTLLGLGLLPVLGIGAILLAWNWFNSKRQQLIVSHTHLWVQGSAPTSKGLYYERKSITKVEVRQSWLQAKLGAGDLLIYCRDLQHPLKITGLVGVEAVKQRLARRIPVKEVVLPTYMVVPVGKARWAPRFKPAAPLVAAA